MPKLCDKDKLEREMKSDLAWLRLKADRLIDSLLITQGKIADIKWRLRKLRREK